MTEVEGIDVQRVTSWFGEHVEGSVAPLTFRRFSGGHSNLTYEVVDAAGSRYVLRRPPMGHVLATAHDMSREHRVMAALGPTAVPVPPTYGLCSDDSVNGAPFYVMAKVEGHVVRDPQVAVETLDEAARRRAGESVAETLAAMHAVDVDAVGLGDLGKKESYVARQLKRWLRQFGESNALTDRRVPEIEAVHDALAARIPEQGPATIVHGDYRLDNTIVDDHGTVLAVLDWELCTLGDPLADVGQLLLSWTEPGDDDSYVVGVMPTTAPGFPTRAEILDCYAKASGRDLSQIEFYLAFCYWRMACIYEGVYTRYAAGAAGEVPADVAKYSDGVVRLAKAAADLM